MKKSLSTIMIRTCVSFKRFLLFMKLIWLFLIFTGYANSDSAGDSYPCNNQILIIYDVSGSEPGLDDVSYKKEINFLIKYLFDEWNHFENLALMSFADTVVDFQPYGRFKNKDQLTNHISESNQIYAANDICKLANSLLSQHISLSYVIIFWYVNAFRRPCCDVTKLINDKAELLTVVSLQGIADDDVYSFFPGADTIPWDLQKDGVTPNKWKNKFLGAYGCAVPTISNPKTTTVTTTTLPTLSTTLGIYGKSHSTETTIKHESPKETTLIKSVRTTRTFTSYSIMLTTQAINTKASTNYILYIVISALLLIVIILVLFICFCLRKCRNRQSTTPTQHLFSNGPNTIANFYVKNPYDQWKLWHTFVKIDYKNKLGSGAFADVYIAHLSGDAAIKRVYKDLPELADFHDCKVAVKMLLPLADNDAKNEFQKEINLMKSFKPHPHLITFLGYVSDIRNLFLVLEYCGNGNLLNFLRINRNQFVENKNSFFNTKTLTSFAWQISNGFEYLSSLQLIHRDIAARNILLTTENVCKISDFGLCRTGNISNSQIYLSRAKKLPIRWMALESLKHFEFSIKTDIWSYGVLLYEIFSLAGMPYENMENPDILKFLDSGERLPKPSHASTEIYDVMKSCWHLSPNNRPTFSTICQQLNDTLKMTTPHSVSFDDIGLQSTKLTFKSLSSGYNTV